MSLTDLIRRLLPSRPATVLTPDTVKRSVEANEAKLRQRLAMLNGEGDLYRKQPKP